MKVFLDIDTQLDFMLPAGSLHSPGAENLIPAIAKLNHYAAEQNIPLISSTDAHPEDAHEFCKWPPHCVTGTVGQQKPASTVLSPRLTIPWNSTFDFTTLNPAIKQIILEKNDLDLFSNPNLPALLDKLNATECYVYGVFIDYCVKHALMGLLRSGRRVFLVRDASASISAAAGDTTIREFIAAGGSLVSMADVASGAN